MARDPSSLLPWDRRGELGMLRAFWQTCWATVSHPVALFNGARSEGSIASSFLFALLASIVGYVPTMAVYAVIAWGVLAAVSARTPEATAPPATVLAGILAVYTVVLPLLAAAWSVLNAAFDHLVLRSLGEPRGFEVTFRATALSMGPMIFGLVPLCGPSILPIWSVVLRIFAYQGLHRTTAGRAAAGALTSFLAFCGLGVAFYAAMLIPEMLQR